MLKEVEDFKYLGSWVNSTEKDLKVRKALAWRALNGMTCVWTSNLPRQIKLSFFNATVESVLLYGSECWSLKPTLYTVKNKKLRKLKIARQLTAINF